MKSNLSPFRTLFFILCMVLPGRFLFAVTADTSRVDRLLAEGDRLVSEQFDNKAALRKYLEAFGDDSTSAEALWRISRAYVDIGEHLPVDTEEEKSEQLKTYELSLAYADRAIQADPGNSMAFTRRAIAKGRIALFKGIWESLSLVKETRADVDSALARDPNNDVANYMMGRVHMKVSEKPKIFRWPLGLGWASTEDAVLYFEKSITLKPNFIMYLLDCARAHIEEDEYNKARAHLTLIETLGKRDEDDDQFKKEARALLEEIKGKE